MSQTAAAGGRTKKSQGKSELAAGLLEDDRFAKLFSNPDFAIQTVKLGAEEGGFTGNAAFVAGDEEPAEATRPSKRHSR